MDMDDQTDPARTGWLLYHSVGMFPGQRDAARSAFESFVETWYRPDSHRWDYGLGLRRRVLDDWAALVNVPASSVFAADSVTDAFARLVGALGAGRLAGRRVLIAGDCFPSLHYLLTGLAPVFGFTLDTVALEPGAAYVDDDAYLAHWQDDVALAVVTWVTSTASKRADLARLVAHGRAQGSLIAVDATQGVGIVDFDATRFGIDFAACTTLKWLCGAPGAALAYLNPALLERGLAPLVQGWFSQPDPFNWDLTRFTLAPDARRFDNGTPSLLPFVASAPGFAWRASPEAAGMRAHNLALSHRLIELFDRKGYRVLSPRDDAERGGSVMAELPPFIEPRALEATLARDGVLIDTRGRTLRASPGPLTRSAAIDTLSTLLPDA
ncbi:aminotransferase class V-fold PLP-dependent enzyme [Burkholderia sp. IMCC1007]|uniref:aminotransferase class V-fold PLP-dependent enzyme n=1 Tax=Burkholderia sp. IMCC1007 TaxID=3004104 RepID=UPI0022B46594|nr:aminotransferase class V-fold PLP-dependent enzyme [Burkholderia sp. IMCC1007]